MSRCLLAVCLTLYTWSIYRNLSWYSDSSPYKVYAVDAALSSINANLIYYLYERKYFYFRIAAL